MPFIESQPVNRQKYRIVNRSSYRMPDPAVDIIVRPMARTPLEEKLPEPFREMLAEAGLTAHAASVLAGNADLLRNFARGRSRTLHPESIAALAQVLQKSSEAVSIALDQPFVPSMKEQLSVAARRAAGGLAERMGRLTPRSQGGLPVRYAVQAGAFVAQDEQRQAPLSGPPVFADPDFDGVPQWLELVRGDSMNRFFPEGSWVHAVDAIAIGYAPRPGDFVVVERQSEQGGKIERSLKQVAISKGRVQLWPRSTNPEYNAPLTLDDGDNEETTVSIAAFVVGGYLSTKR